MQLFRIDGDPIPTPAENKQYIALDDEAGTVTLMVKLDPVATARLLVADPARFRAVTSTAPGSL